jgi:hypothetical protein
MAFLPVSLSIKSTRALFLCGDFLQRPEKFIRQVFGYEYEKHAAVIIFAQSEKLQKNQCLYLCTQDNISEIWNSEYRQGKII